MGVTDGRVMSTEPLAEDAHAVESFEDGGVR